MTLEKIRSSVASDQNSGLTMLEKLRRIGSKDYNPEAFHSFDYWEHQKMDKDLYTLSQIVLSVPATQVSVERAFSALSLVLTKFRTRLSKDVLNEVLIIKLNKEVFHRLNINYIDIEQI